MYYDADQFDFSLFFKVIPIKINTEQLNTFLLGKIPQNVFDNKFKLTGDEKDGLLVFTSVNGEDVLYVNHDFRKIVKAKFRLNTGEILKVEYGDFKFINKGLYFPKMLKLKYMNYMIYIKYDDDIEINDEINQSNYSVNP